MKNRVDVTVILPDLHLSPKMGKEIKSDVSHDRAALSVALQVIRDLKPNRIVQLGDITEMTTISKYAEKDGTAGMVRGKDKQIYWVDWETQLVMVDDFWGYLRATNPKAELVQLEGNHDFRVEVYLNKPQFIQFKDKLHIRTREVWKKCNVTYINYDGVDECPPWYDVGKARILHGYGAGTCVKMRQQHDNCIFGHSHKIDYNGWDKNSRENRRAWNIGCLCELSPEYSSLGGNQNGNAHGFAILYTLPNQVFRVEQLEIIDGVLPYFNGKTYIAKPLSKIHKMLKGLE